MPRTSKRDDLQPSDTPFAKVLTTYMWAKQPPWSANRLAATLGLNKARVVNWIYHDSDPDLGTMLDIMARLNIPVSTLIDAYAAKGLPVPPLTPTGQSGQSGQTGPTGPTVQSGPVGQQPKMTAAERERQREQEREQEWQTMLAHTREVMRMTGMSEPAIDGMLAHLSADRERHRDGQPSERERRMAEEMSEGSEGSEEMTEHTESTTGQPGSRSRPSSSRS